MPTRFSEKDIQWNTEKNQILKQERGVGFEDILVAIAEGRGIKIQEAHYNEDKYPNQKIVYVEIGHYVYIVPFIEDEEHIFFKTIIPSRKHTKLFLW